MDMILCLLDPETSNKSFWVLLDLTGGPSCLGPLGWHAGVMQRSTQTPWNAEERKGRPCWDPCPAWLPACWGLQPMLAYL